eukprot:CAMPEP_0116827894 /NCGR_PEP_ID=MMETSP0418-20121206/3356_1 /TAXON_ID=1158023 /ORGANISM="Astrosyne radiata, Strain 13vi08-1A" /LENGTH=189 /DNA_ID=CAMNT_0004456727 /DNA_START=74 /DNA_END=645 /DNA_ORIENTATION=+
MTLEVTPVEAFLLPPSIFLCVGNESGAGCAYDVCNSEPTGFDAHNNNNNNNNKNKASKCLNEAFLMRLHDKEDVISPIDAVGAARRCVPGPGAHPTLGVVDRFSIWVILRYHHRTSYSPPTPGGLDPLGVVLERQLSLTIYSTQYGTNGGTYVCVCGVGIEIIKGNSTELTIAGLMLPLKRAENTGILP